MVLLRLLQFGNCVGDEGTCEKAEVLFSVTTAEAQQLLVLFSSIICFVKIFISIFTYSFFLVGISIMELACTILAFVIFIIEDYQADFIQQIEAGYGDDIKLYLVAFIGAIFVESMSTFLTFQTVHLYKSVDGDATMSEVDCKVYNKGAITLYLVSLLTGVAMGGAVPLISFGIGGWEKNYFAPTNFNEDNAKLLMSSLILALATFGLMGMAIMYNWVSFRRRLGALYAVSVVGLAPILASGVIMYTVLGRTDGVEAGGLSYLCMIGALQALSFSGDFFRYIFWLQIDLIRKTSKLAHHQMEDDSEI